MESISVCPINSESDRISEDGCTHHSRVLTSAPRRRDIRAVSARRISPTSSSASATRFRSFSESDCSSSARSSTPPRCSPYRCGFRAVGFATKPSPCDSLSSRRVVANTTIIRRCDARVIMKLHARRKSDRCDKSCSYTAFALLQQQLDRVVKIIARRVCHVPSHAFAFESSCPKDLSVSGSAPADQSGVSLYDTL